MWCSCLSSPWDSTEGLSLFQLTWSHYSLRSWIKWQGMVTIPWSTVPTLWLALQFLTLYYLLHWLVEGLWPRHEPRLFHMERKHEPRYALWDEEPDLLALMLLHLSTTRTLLTLTTLNVWWRKVWHIRWPKPTVTWSSLGKLIVIAEVADAGKTAEKWLMKM